MGGLAFLGGHTSEPVAEATGARASAMAEAWTLAQEGEAALAEREPGAALAAFRHAFELSRDPTLLFELARLEQELGHGARATHAFEQFLLLGTERAPVRHLQLAERELRVASAVTARLSVRTNVVGAEVELEAERGVAIAEGFVVNVVLDAGERRLSFSKPGYETRSLVLRIEPGEQRSLRVDLEKAAGGRSDTGLGKPRWTRTVAPSPHHG
jgi:hypothetical protein